MRTSTRQDWLAAAAILAGLIAVYLIPAATTGASAARAVAAMAISALIAMAVARAPFTFALRVRTGFVLLIALALWYVTTRLWAVDPAGSMVESSRVSAFVLLAWATHTCVIGVGARRLLLGGIAAAGLSVSVEPLWDALRDGAPTVRVAGELGYWNATAIVALVLVPTAVALAGTGRRRLIVLAGALIPIAGVTAVASASRGALAALAVALLIQALLDPDHRGGLPRALVAGGSLALVVVGLAMDGMPVAVSLLGPALVAIGGFGLIRARRVRRERAKLSVVAVDAADAAPARRRAPRAVQVAGIGLMLALAGLLVALVLDANEGDVPGRGAPPATGDVTRLASTDDSQRLDWWREGVDLWKDAPIHGKGGGAFGALHVEGRGTNLQHVHSMPIEVLLETGLVGALLLVAATVLFLRVLRQGHRSTERALAGAIAALVLVQSVLDWTLSLPQVLVLLAIAGPLALVRPEPVADVASRREPPLWQPLTMLLALAAATTVALTPMLAALLADQAAHRFDDGAFAESASLAEQSLLLVPSIDTLTVQVLSLQNAGDSDAAAQALRSNQQVWSHQLAGLELARLILEDDPELGPLIERRTAELEAARDARTPGLN
jgi:hypothetical protein